MINVLIYGGLSAQELNLVRKIVYSLDFKPAKLTFLNCLEPSNKQKGFIMDLEDIILKDRKEKTVNFLASLSTRYLNVTGDVKYGVATKSLKIALKENKPNILFYVGETAELKNVLGKEYSSSNTSNFLPDASVFIDKNSEKIDFKMLKTVFYTTTKELRQKIQAHLNLLITLPTKTLKSSTIKV